MKKLLTLLFRVHDQKILDLQVQLAKAETENITLLNIMDRVCAENDLLHTENQRLRKETLN